MVGNKGYKLREHIKNSFYLRNTQNHTRAVLALSGSDTTDTQDADYNKKNLIYGQSELQSEPSRAKFLDFFTQLNNRGV